MMDMYDYGPPGSGGPGYMGGGGGAMTGLAALYPEDPLLEEDNSADTQFVIEFTVELLKPEAARKTEPFELNGQSIPAAPAEEQTPEAPEEPAEDANRAASAIREEPQS